MLATVAHAQNTGEADFSRYVALGDSLTAGVSANSLELTEQTLSVANLIATQAGVSLFVQPLIAYPGLPNQLEVQSLNPLVVAPTTNAVLVPPDATATPPETGSFVTIFYPAPYDNLGIPGMNVNDALTTVCSSPILNPLTADYSYFCPILRNPECEPVFADPATGSCASASTGTTALEQALSLDPTFMTVWLGSNDVLRAVASGMVIEGVTITPLNEFTVDYQQIIDEIDAAGVQMALANVPNVPVTPYASTVPPVIPGAGGWWAETRVSPANLDTEVRQLTTADFVLLPATTLIPPAGTAGTSQADPLPDNVVLDAVEASIVTQRILDFNAVIEAEAQSVGAAYVDIFALFEEVTQNGFEIGGVELTTDYLTGGLFSYDGIHPAAAGYGIAAQSFIDAINETYSASIPLINFGQLLDPTPTISLIPAVTEQEPFVFPASGQDRLMRLLARQDIESLRAIEERIRNEGLTQRPRDELGRTVPARGSDRRR
jgi:lysophospholipase L1-like esterase